MSAFTGSTTAPACSRASAATRRRRARPCSGSPTTCSGCTTRRGCSTWRSRTRSRSCATATHELVRANGLPACYIRPIAFFGYGSLGVHTRGNPVETVIMSWPWGAYLGEDGADEGHHGEDLVLEACRAERDPARRRRRPGSTSTRCSRRPRRSAAATTRAILLTDDGFVADGPGENIFVVKDGRILTPPLSTSILPGITRDCVIQIAQDLGYVVEETPTDPRRPLARRRGVHDRHRRRGDAGARGRRRRARRRARDARDPAALPRHGQRPQRALEPLARRRRGSMRRPSSAPPRTKSGATRSVAAATPRQIGLSAPWLDEREEELVDRGAPLGPAVARADDRPASRRRSPRRSGAPYAAAVSSGTAGLHLLCIVAGVSPATR